LWGSFRLRYMLIQRDEDELVAKLVWRVNLVAELEPGLTTEVEVARIERDQRADLVDLGLRLAESKQLTAALQAEMVPAQVTIAGECHRSCATCGHVLAGKGHYTATFPFLVRRRPGSGPAPVELSLPRFGKGKELRCHRH
jgi:hypothetical protein